MEDKKNYIVFTAKVAGFLIMKGFYLKGIEPNRNYPLRNVFIFNDSIELRNAISEYDKFIEVNKEWFFK